eukprot:scaffold217142_cov32-Attheya_sp.AAC.1
MAPTTRAPVVAVTGEPTTAAPTDAPSVSPTHVLLTATTEGITMDLTGVQEPLTILAILDFQKQTNQYVKDYYNKNLGTQPTTQAQVFDVACSIVVDQDASLGRRQLRTDTDKRHLQSIL